MFPDPERIPSGTPTQGAHPWNRYVALGDSFTEGFGDPEPQSPGGVRGWADRVAEELSTGHSDFAYANLAVRGRLLQQIVDEQVGPALELKPDLVTFSAGGNDLVFRGADPDRLAEKLDPAVRSLSSTGATVVIFTGPDWGSTPVFSHIRGKVAIFNEHLRTIAARYDGVIADLWALRQLSDPRMWDPDRLHFSPLGHHTIAAMVLETLNVPHTLKPLEPKALPASSWREARSSDLIWAKDYLFPWVLRKVRQRPATPGLLPKRPEPGPAYSPGMREEEAS
ncbi:SGNH/GDSL hydrolase family protein [Arthrobacter sp. ISL-72]|nr:SGNH/GDSL hydrolase family protein [Arthrobacter sp. ISL-72]MBT2597625.1 SGNH/GDSL hydrolase family protein [Arthrobacter sp. ISL-72]